MRLARRDQRIRRRIIAGHQSGEIRAQRHARRTGQRGEIQDEVGLLLARTGQSIAQDQATLGIGVPDLDR